MTLKKLLQVLAHVGWVVFLTAITQIGGLVWLACLLLFPRITFTDKWKRIGVKAVLFLTGYLLFTFTIVPFLAAFFGRVPLPVTHSSLKPLNLVTVLLNRRYVQKQLRAVAIETAEKMHQQFPETITHYLDAGFPFINGFPLLPHLSHNDGRKLDLAFYYQTSYTHQPVNTAPSPIGYGICEEPLPGEVNTAFCCATAGWWQYSALKKIIPQGSAKLFRMDSERTRAMLVQLATDKRVGKLFIEPHLKTRMKLSTYTKIRFQGCGAVSHDDHIHVQL